jgi:hypothetical protein
VFAHHNIGSPVVGIGSHTSGSGEHVSGAARAWTNLISTRPALPAVSNFRISAPKKGPSEEFTI